MIPLCQLQRCVRGEDPNRAKTVLISEIDAIGGQSIRRCVNLRWRASEVLHTRRPGKTDQPMTGCQPPLSRTTLEAIFHDETLIAGKVREVDSCSDKLLAVALLNQSTGTRGGEHAEFSACGFEDLTMGGAGMESVRLSI